MNLFSFISLLISLIKTFGNKEESQKFKQSFDRFLEKLDAILWRLGLTNNVLLFLCCLISFIAINFYGLYTSVLLYEQFGILPYLVMLFIGGLFLYLSIELFTFLQNKKRVVN